MSEAARKLELLRTALSAHGLAGYRLRGVEWFAWATAGGSNVVLLTAETGIAEVFVTLDHAYVLTTSIETERLEAEEVPLPYVVWAAPWQESERREAFVRGHVGGGRIASDRPVGAEVPLPPEIYASASQLSPAEVERYRSLGADAARAMTATLAAAKPEWSEQELAGRAAAALWAAGIHPALTLVGGEARVAAYRHPTPTAARIGERAMLVCCARRHGLFANLTRFVYFRQPTGAEMRLRDAVGSVEAAAWRASRPGEPLAAVYRAIAAAYAAVGYGGEEDNHHQGGPTGYLSRLEIATPHSERLIQDRMALAWNPSLPGVKSEDTVLCRTDGCDVLTVDPDWPTYALGGRARPDFLVRP